MGWDSFQVFGDHWQNCVEGEALIHHKIAYPLSWPGNLRLVLTPHMTLDMSWIDIRLWQTDDNDRGLLGSNLCMWDFWCGECERLCRTWYRQGSASSTEGKTHNASLSIQIVRSQLSTSWCMERRELYGWYKSATNQQGVKISLTSTTVSETCNSTLVINLTWKMLVTDIRCRKNWKRRKHSIGIFLFRNQYMVQSGVCMAHLPQLWQK